MAHTQGPWRIGEPRDGFIGNVLADNPRRLLAQVTVQDGEQTLANARLMAAAPDMLDALKNLLWYVGQLEMLVYSADDAGEHEEVAKARAAIAKAEEKNS